MVTKLQVGIFTVAWWSYAVTYFIRKPLGVIKSDLADELQLSTSYLGWLDTAQLLPYAVVQMLSGRFVETMGPRKTLYMCLTLAAVSAITFGMWSSYGMLFLLLLISGAAQAPCWPACCHCIRMWCSDENFNSIFGIVSTSAFGGSILASALAVHFQNEYGWRFVYFPLCSITLFVAAVVALVMFSPEEYGVKISGNESQEKQSLTEENKNTDSVLQISVLWRIPCVAELSLSMMCLKLVRYCMYFWLPMFLQHSLSFSKAQAGIFSILFDFGGIFGSGLSGMILDRYFKNANLVGVGLMQMSCTISFILFVLTKDSGMVFNGLFLVIAGASICGPDSMLGGSVAVSIGDVSLKGSGSAVAGMINGFGSFGGVIEGPLVGYVSDAFGWTAMFLLMIFLSLIGTFTIFKAHIIQRNLRRACQMETI